MNFSIHINTNLAKDLEVLTKRSGKSRNAIIGEALQAYLRQNIRREWPKSVLQFIGADSEFPPFESHRSELPQPKEDPLK